MAFALYMLSLSVVLLGLMVGCLAGWSLKRRKSRSPWGRILLLIITVIAFALIQTLFLQPGVWRLGIVLPSGPGQTVQMPLHFLVNQAFASFFCGGVCCYVLLTRHRLRWPVAAGGMLLLAFAVVLPATRGSIADELREKRSADGVVLQSTGYSCAAAVCANIAEYYGFSATEKKMAYKLGLTDLGSTLEQIAYLLDSLGLETERIRLHPPDTSRLRVPAILSVYHPDTGPDTHLVIFMGANDSSMEIWDPLTGKTYVTEPELREVWRGLVVQVERK